MPLVTKNFDLYGFNYIGGTSLQKGEPGAVIDCFDGTTRVGSITFFRDGLALPDNKVQSDNTLGLYYQMGRYDDVVTTLRYTKPLMLAINTDTGFGYLGAPQLEKVGQQEGV